MWNQIVQRTWAENHLFSVLVELTYRCNWDCVFCYNDLGLRGEPLSLDQYSALLEDLAELGVMHLVLSGGEPLAHPHFLEIGTRARELGFLVRLKSNGHALRGALAREVRDRIDPFLIEVSLHGATAEVHDRQTRVPGSFERLLGNLRELRELGLRVKINSVLTRWNEHQIRAIYAVADDLGLPIRIDPDVSPRDDGDRSPLELSPSPQAVAELLRITSERAREQTRVASSAPDPAPALTPAGKHCGAGSSSLAIDPFGNVYPCVQWRRSVGNLHRRGVAEIWRASPMLREVREITGDIHRDFAAAPSESTAALGFCPGAAEANTGDPKALYPAATRRAEARDLVRPVRALNVVSS